MSSCLTVAAIGIHLLSHHTHGDYNNDNRGAYIQTECGLTAGIYKNSINKTSVHLGYSYDVPNIPVFVSVGVVTGYEIKPVVPVIMPGLYVKARDYRIRMGYIPKAGKANDSHVFHLMLEKRF